MKVSVVIPVYNRTTSLKDAIESVFLQKYPDIEIIVVDDGSGEKVNKNLRPYMSRIKYIRAENNRGVSAARNLGIHRARGDYIAFLDSDDLWLPGKLKEQIKLMEKEKTKVCHTDEFWYKKDKFVNQGVRHKKYGGWIFPLILDICRISPSTIIMHKTVIENSGKFDENFPACEDYDFWLRIASKFKISYLPAKLVVKRAYMNDQLSLNVPYMEYYRLLSLIKFVKKNCRLSYTYLKAAYSEIERKYNIVKKGIDKYQ
ncbi:MAG: glycosyltransferase [Flexistipes sinusarabici]|uniref:Glycosyltransferase n=1 Tax=Flexistipes sinusarabici TaxID=2352 RepID=A0A5D0MRJ4_FLESI|nr:glycosyltransferase [Flexistipes sinusarabici]TYB33529.1 MAG: glycosyltransferase [Flexistipes sinusarabici]